MIEVINNYHVDYYFRNKIIDCGQISEELQLHLKLEETERAIDDIIDITELEKQEEYLRSCDNQQKQEETKINDNSMEDEENYYNMDNSNNIYKLSNIKVDKSRKKNYNYKREKNELPKTTRIDKFSLRKRNVLLDKFSKPKLN